MLIKLEILISAIELFSFLLSKPLNLIFYPKIYTLILFLIGKQKNCWGGCLTQ